MVDHVALLVRIDRRIDDASTTTTRLPLHAMVAGCVMVTVVPSHVRIDIELPATPGPGTTKGRCACVGVDVDTQAARSIETLETSWADVLLSRARLVGILPIAELRRILVSLPWMRGGT